MKFNDKEIVLLKHIVNHYVTTKFPESGFTGVVKNSRYKGSPLESLIEKIWIY
jgi:hypothetical protein